MAVRRRWIASVCAVLAAVATAVAPGTAQAARPLIRPAITGHVNRATLSFPPTTAYCRKNLAIACYSPVQLERAYGIGVLARHGITGRGRTIVIVDAFGSPTIKQDLAHFDRHYGIPAPPSFRVIQPAGRVPAYPADPFGKADRAGWAFETTLDVEYAHAMAPGAKILLVETPQSETEGLQGFPQIIQAENYVVRHHLGDVISQSFGATEQTFPSKASIRSLQSAYVNARRAGITVLASSGDSGATDSLPDLSCCYDKRVTSFPPDDPLVTAVGGTQLNLDAQGNRLSPDVVWNDGYGAGGGGKSTVFSRPWFQNPVRRVVGASRGVPDVSMSAAVDGAAIVYFSFCNYNDDTSPPVCGPQWHLTGGTSEASPLFAGIVALADQAAGHRLGWLNPRLYALGVNGSPRSRANGLVDVTSGNNSYTFCTANCGEKNEVDTTVTGYQATRGYDLASGLGTVYAPLFVRALAAQRWRS